MSVIRLPITRRQLVNCVADYQTAFPGWVVERGLTLTRNFGPVRQVIAFEALRSGAYRPSCSIDVLTTPSSQLLFSFLDIKHRQVTLRRHTEVWPHIVQAMEKQFRPSIRESIDVREIIRLAEQEIAEARAGNSRYLSGVASLNAYVGDKTRALFWCDKIDADLSSSVLTEWEVEVRQLAFRIRSAVINDQVKSLFFSAEGRS